MTDRELLELAAKAAGLSEHGWMGDSYCHVVNNTWATFDPLNDDGDALRLAVKLRLDIQLECSPTYHYAHSDEYECCAKGSECNNDPYAATRRAIVLAAAAIGNDMK